MSLWAIKQKSIGTIYKYSLILLKYKVHAFLLGIWVANTNWQEGIQGNLPWLNVIHSLIQVPLDLCLQQFLEYLMNYINFILDFVEVNREYMLCFKLHLFKTHHPKRLGVIKYHNTQDSLQLMALKGVHNQHQSIWISGWCYVHCHNVAILLNLLWTGA